MPCLYIVYNIEPENLGGFSPQNPSGVYTHDVATWSVLNMLTKGGCVISEYLVQLIIVKSDEYTCRRIDCFSSCMRREEPL